MLHGIMQFAKGAIAIAIAVGFLSTLLLFTIYRELKSVKPADLDLKHRARASQSVSPYAS